MKFVCIGIMYSSEIIIIKDGKDIPNGTCCVLPVLGQIQSGSVTIDAKQDRRFLYQWSRVRRLTESPE